MNDAERLALVLLEHHVRSRETAGLIRDALYDCATSAFDLGPRELPIDREREWLRGAVAVAIADATSAAQEAFEWSLVRAVTSVPNSFAHAD